MDALRDAAKDPCVMAFDKLMDFSESYGTHSTFFFMASQPGKHDDGYAVDSPLFRSLRDRIHARGHHMGWHPSFDAADDEAVFVKELDSIRRALQSAEFGVRHHFLRWRAGFSWRRLAAHGSTFDASVGYNYCVGFRAQTARPYPAYDLQSDVVLPLMVQPLIAMDGPLIRGAMPVAHSLSSLRRRCNAVNGQLSLLIHNYSLMNDPSLLESIAQGLEGRGVD